LAEGIQFGTPGYDWDDGRRGPTADDILEWNGNHPFVNPQFKGKAVVSRQDDWSLSDTSSWVDRSRLLDQEFARLRRGGAWPSPYFRDWRDGDGPGGPLRMKMGDAYVPGSLTGLWVGPMMVRL
jgi:hypothetical protein